MERFRLAHDYEISQVIRGGWQMAAGHSAVGSTDPVADMIAYADSGVTTFDCADIYTGVEAMIGEFRRAYRQLRGEESAKRLRVHTKFVPDLDILPRIQRSDVERIIDRSLKRLDMERLDLVQFHWWDYASPRWLETAGWLDELRRAGKINLLGGTNFDTQHMLDIIESGVPLASMQVQYSLLDRRPAKAMAAAAARYGVWLLCYGAVAGGFLSDKWLGAAAPDGKLENRSLVKYRLIIEEFGGWALFQRLLAVLRRIADRHGVDIATVASAATLERDRVAAVIVGARDRSHLQANLAVSALKLSDDERHEIDAVIAEANDLPGEVYALERDRAGRHGGIMKYNLSSNGG
jgi:aryl-alcohol dehydrogenase-like predicted oxidoreductase